nr:MAG: ORF1 [TTV-like mini virus]
MPWKWYNYYNRRRWRPRRRRRFWTWRPRKTFFRTRYRRRHWVRKYPKKLRKITVKEYQPQTIKKCRIKGLMCLVFFNKKRLANNSVMYEDSTVPKHLPGGGGFSVMRFSLESLYTSHLLCRNWWTVSNEDLPLCRYTGCKFRFYQSDNVDYCVRYQISYPMMSNKLTYASCHPSIMLMMKNTIIVPSKKTRPRKKPYKTKTFRPPSQLQTKWYFQQDLNKTPLILLQTCACSLEHYYISTNWESVNITIKHLNNKVFKNQNFATVTTTGYPISIEGTVNTYLYYTRTVTHDLDKVQIGDVVPLTQTKYYRAGQSANELHITHSQYKEQLNQHTGNPFTNEYLTNPDGLFTSPKDPATFFLQFTNTTDKLETKKTILNYNLLQHPLILETRYNPNKDQGLHNKAYVLPVNKPGVNWTPPNDEDLIIEGFPIWLLIFGFLDYIKKTQKLINVDEKHVLCIQTSNTNPKWDQPIIPLSYTFEEGHSPYSKVLNPYDTDKWYPQIQYQEEAINDIIKCGPGTAKIGDRLSEEIKCEYQFYWKWGGHPPKMLTIDNPAQQGTYPIPRNSITSNSLQNPATPPEYFLYSFDERQGLLTKTAAKRIKKDWGSKDYVSDFTESTKEVPMQTLQTSSDETSDSEKEEETLLEQLQRQQQHQKQLKRRILRLMQKNPNLE